MLAVLGGPSVLGRMVVGSGNCMSHIIAWLVGYVREYEHHRRPDEKCNIESFITHNAMATTMEFTSTPLFGKGRSGTGSGAGQDEHATAAQALCLLSSVGTFNMGSE